MKMEVIAIDTDSTQADVVSSLEKPMTLTGFLRSAVDSDTRLLTVGAVDVTLSIVRGYDELDRLASESGCFPSHAVEIEKKDVVYSGRMVEVLRGHELEERPWRLLDFFSGVLGEETY